MSGDIHAMARQLAIALEPRERLPRHPRARKPANPATARHRRLQWAARKARRKGEGR